ncbi:hypothetical protein GCM10027065_01210 [Rhodanobacter koreensis]
MPDQRALQIVIEIAVRAQYGKQDQEIEREKDRENAAVRAHRSIAGTGRIIMRNRLTHEARFPVQTRMSITTTPHWPYQAAPYASPASKPEAMPDMLPVRLGSRFRVGTGYVQAGRNPVGMKQIPRTDMTNRTTERARPALLFIAG